MTESSSGLAAPSTPRPNVVDSLSDVPWQELERLTEAILRAKHRNAIVLPLNLSGGRGADGLDFAVEHPNGQTVGYQVKAERHVTPAKFADWVSTFVTGHWTQHCRTFVILSAYDLSPRVVKKYLDLRDALLSSHGIRLCLQAAGWYQDHLEMFPEVAEVFLTEEQYANIRPRSILRRAQREAQRRKASERNRIANIDPDAIGFEECSIGANFPTAAHPAISALFTVNEPGLYGAQIALGNDALLDAFESTNWRDDIPFSVAGDGNSLWLQLGNVRFHASRDFACRLASSVKRLSSMWHQHVMAIDRRRESVGYRYIDQMTAVVLGRMKPALWAAILDFAKEHVYSEGASPFHTFYDHHSYLDIFTGDRNSALRPGRHAIVRTRERVRSANPLSDDFVDIIWQVPPRIVNQNDQFGYETWWTAHETASWIETELIPAVWEWHFRDTRRGISRLFQRRALAPILDLNSYWTSLRATLFSETHPEDATGLRFFVRRLQSHFALRDDSNLPGTTMNAIDTALLRLLERADLPHLGYLRSKAELASQERSSMITELRARSTSEYGPVSATWLEWRLRAFAEICETSALLTNAAEAEAVGAVLREIAEIADQHTVRQAHRIKECSVFPKEF